jgi:hypothetical protein
MLRIEEDRLTQRRVLPEVENAARAREELERLGTLRMRMLIKVENRLQNWTEEKRHEIGNTNAKDRIST